MVPGGSGADTRPDADINVSVSVYQYDVSVCQYVCVLCCRASLAKDRAAKVWLPSSR